MLKPIPTTIRTNVDGSPDRRFRHGHSGKAKTPEYYTWSSLLARCKNPASPAWENYGGRGIAVHPEWESFQAFLDDVGNRPSEAHSLDRWPNKNGNYEPGNVRWATIEQQNRNARSNRQVEIEGHLRSVAEWAEISGVKRHTIYKRLDSNWPAKRAVFFPTRRLSR